MSPIPQIVKLIAISPSMTPMTILPSQLAEAVRIPRSMNLFRVVAGAAPDR
jgi:hypothetical protein